MLTQGDCIFLCIVCSFLTGIVCYFIGKWDKEDKHTIIQGTKLKLIEGIDGVSSVQLTPIRYVELLTKEEECNELKLAIKRFADETPKGN